MSSPLIQGFSPYNVPIKSGRNAGLEARPTAGQARQEPLQPATGGRASEPAVQVRLSAAALALLNGGVDGANATVSRPAAAAADAIAGGESRGSDVSAASARPSAATSAPASPRYIAPGSTLDILI